MTASPRPAAALSAGLLARKGQARPAMRPQGAEAGDAAGDDLGWNDMGEAAAAPIVLVQRTLLEARIGSPVAQACVPVATAARIRDETQQQGRSALTLPIDADRHLRLRLAMAVTNRSAQDLVTEALDALLGAVPEVEALVAQLPRTNAARQMGTDR